jgi:hypothetical protein
MSTRLRRQGSLIVLAAVAWGWTGSVMAQEAGQAPTASLADVAARVPIGEVVYVTDSRGMTAKGKLAAVTTAAVQVYVGTDLRTVAAADIGRIQWQKPDSPLTGILLGAGIGAIPGIYWLIADPNECTGMCPEDYVAIAAGAAIGGFIDHAIKKKVTVYRAGAPHGRESMVTIRPFATRGRRGVQLAVRF